MISIINPLLQIAICKANQTYATYLLGQHYCPLIVLLNA